MGRIKVAGGLSCDLKAVMPVLEQASAPQFGRAVACVYPDLTGDSGYQFFTPVADDIADSENAAFHPAQCSAV